MKSFQEMGADLFCYFCFNKKKWSPEISLHWNWCFTCLCLPLQWHSVVVAAHQQVPKPPISMTTLFSFQAFTDFTRWCHRISHPPLSMHVEGKLSLHTAICPCSYGLETHRNIQWKKKKRKRKWRRNCGLISSLCLTATRILWAKRQGGLFVRLSP